MPLSALRPHLANTTLEPAEIGGRGQGVVSIEFQNYAAHYGTAQAPSNPGMSVTNEVELDILAYPQRWKKEGRVPDISLEDFVLGQQQTKTIGSYRLGVTADNLVAVKAGADEFGEQKFFTLFDYEVPCENNASAWLTDWSYTVLDPAYAAQLQKNPPKNPTPPPPSGFIYKIEAHVGDLAPQVGNPSPLTLLSTIPAKQRLARATISTLRSSPNARTAGGLCCPATFCWRRIGISAEISSVISPDSVRTQ